MFFIKNLLKNNDFNRKQKCVLIINNKNYRIIVFIDS